jgi:tetratricopeptide (TPR) repeat protein
MGFPQTHDELERDIARQTRIVLETADADDERALRRRGDALWLLGEDLFRLGRFEESVPICDEAAETLWPFVDERHSAVHARWRQATTLTVLGRCLEALTVVERLVKDIGPDWKAPSLPDLMPLVLGLWVGLLEEVDRQGEVESRADQVIALLEDGNTPGQKMVLARVLLAKAAAVEDRGDTNCALAVLDDVIVRASAEVSGDLAGEFRSLLVAAMVKRGLVLELAGRSDQALSAFDEVLVKYGATPDSDFDDDLGTARASRTRLLSGA